jgi:uncharacterized protein involved in cysteine biosynthesis
MKNAIQLHIMSGKLLVKDLLNGRYLLYFLPGVLVAFVFFNLLIFNQKALLTFQFVENIPWIGSYLFLALKGTFGAFDFILNQIFVFLILTALSPIHTIIGEKVATSLSGKVFNFTLLQATHAVARAFFIALIALFLEVIVLVVYWGISKIFHLDWVDEVVYFLIAACFYGFSFYDYGLERDQKNIAQSILYSLRSVPYLLLTGSLFLAIYAIPIIGIIVAPICTILIATYVYEFYKNPNLISKTT